jgi:hypothetical protein
MSEADKAKALSLVGPINKAFSDLKASYRTSLTHALELGGLLFTAHEAVGKKEWKSYLATNCPQISYRTATVYIQLAKHRDQFTDDPTKMQRAALLGTEGDLSIRGAIEAMNRANGGGLNSDTTKTNDEKDDEDESEDDEVKGFDVMGSKADLAETLKDVAPDEVVIAINEEWEPEDREELLRQQLKSCSPSALSEVLISALGRENTQLLIQTLTRKLQEAAPPAAVVPPPPAAAATSSVRRPLQ